MVSVKLNRCMSELQMEKLKCRNEVGIEFYRGILWVPREFTRLRAPLGKVGHDHGLLPTLQAHSITKWTCWNPSHGMPRLCSSGCKCSPMPKPPAKGSKPMGGHGVALWPSSTYPEPFWERYDKKEEILHSLTSKLYVSTQRQGKHDRNKSHESTGHQINAPLVGLTGNMCRESPPK
jgi:hypothetical protein